MHGEKIPSGAALKGLATGRAILTRQTTPVAGFQQKAEDTQSWMIMMGGYYLECAFTMATTQNVRLSWHCTNRCISTSANSCVLGQLLSTCVIQHLRLAFAVCPSAACMVYLLISS